MSTSTQTLTEQRDQAIAAYDAALAAVAEAQKAGADPQTLARLGGAMGGPKIRIRNIELEMALANESFEPWVQKVSRTRKASRSQSEIRQQIKTLEALAASTPHPTVKRSAQQQIQALNKKLQG